MKRSKEYKSVPECEYAIDDSDRFWDRARQPSEISRLEDIIRIANTGIRVRCFIELKKKNVEIKVNDAEIDRQPSVSIAAFLLLAQYTVNFEKTNATVSKVYVFGRAQQDGGIPEADSDVANQRLYVDYERLRQANIRFDEVYFKA